LQLRRLFLDTDVVVNWLVKEVETASGKPLWEAPYKIIKLTESKAATAIISLTTLMEIRYLLRRKKSYTPQQVEDDISKLTSIFEVVIPDEINLLKANAFQTEHYLDPFDSIHLALCTSLNPDFLVSRDKEFIQIAKQFITALTPEKFLETSI